MAVASEIQWLLVAASGVLSALAQMSIARAYSVAEASFVQPFDFAKLPMNVLAGWLVFGWGAPRPIVAGRRHHHRRHHAADPSGAARPQIRFLRYAMRASFFTRLGSATLTMDIRRDQMFGTATRPAATRALLLGSGELGKEVAIELQRLGIEVIAADRYANAPAMQVAHKAHVLDMLDGAALRALVAEVKPDLYHPRD